MLKSAGATKPPAAGKGRKKGVPNRATADVRECVALIAKNLAPEVETWIRKGAKRSPLGAAKVLSALLEYHIPKLTRTEMTGRDGGPVEHALVVSDDPIEAGRQYQRMISGKKD